MKKLRRKAVAHVNHRSGLYSLLAKSLHDVATSLRLELALQYILLAGKVRLEVFLPGRDSVLSFKKLKTHECGTEVAAHADDVGGLRACAGHDILLVGIAYAGYADHKTCHRCACVSAHKIHAIRFAGKPYA